jgi:hypothetical protein
MVAQSLIVAAGNSGIFTRNLAGRLRWWLLRLPAGVGLATLRSRLALSMLQGSGDINDRNPKQSPPSLPVYLVCLRNLFFLLVVIFHGFRRCLP